MYTRRKNIITQEIYISLDDSGKLSLKESICVYGGIVFFNKEEKDQFINIYKSIINDIKCKYCLNNLKCNNTCPELKNFNITQKDKRRIMNHIKRYYRICLIIKNKEIYTYIMNDKASKGRFIDYAIRIMIKKVLKELILIKKIDSNKPIKLIINIDEQATKSNGYYNLKDSIYEELKYGIVNYNYLNTIEPLIKGDLKIGVTYKDSKKSYTVQAADFLAGTIRRESIKAYNNNSIEEFIKKDVDFKIIIP